MKTKLLKSVLGVSLAVAGLAAGAGTIVGSKHDFSTQAWTTNGQLCVACHAPHNTALGLTVLWNHTLSTATYTMYNNAFSSTINGTVAAAPAGVSKLCLSCHDGTVAVNSFGGATGAVSIAASANLGTNLTNDHPIGITYDAALVTADGALWPIATTANIGTGGTKTRAGTISSNLLYNGSIECASCHDVHNTFTVPFATAGTSGTTNKLVKISMVGSALCLTCHDK